MNSTENFLTHFENQDRTCQSQEQNNYLSSFHLLDQMKHLIKKGKVSILMPEGEGGGLSGEVHLVEYDGNKYVVRRCLDLKKARLYEFISKKLEKKGFLPKFLGRDKKDVFYEYIEGRDLRQNEKMEIYYQLGKIGGSVNKICYDYNSDKEFYKTLRELENGNYNPSPKVLMRRKLSKITRKPKRVLTAKKRKEIQKLYGSLKREINPKISLDISDFVPGNFRLRSGKVFLVDVESIKPRIKGSGVAKFFLNWANTSHKKKRFKEGYQSVSSLKYLDSKYEDLCYLTFIVQALWFKNHVGRDYSSDLELLEKLFTKYTI